MYPRSGRAAVGDVLLRPLCGIVSAMVNKPGQLSLPSLRGLRLRNDLRCVWWGVKLYSLDSPFWVAVNE